MRYQAASNCKSSQQLQGSQGCFVRVYAVCCHGINGVESSSAAAYIHICKHAHMTDGCMLRAVQLQPVGEDIYHKLQMKKDRWKRHAKLSAVEQLLWGRQPGCSMKHKLCSAAARTVSLLLHDARLSVEDMSIILSPEQPPKVCTYTWCSATP